MEWNLVLESITKYLSGLFIVLTNTYCKKNHPLQKI